MRKCRCTICDNFTVVLNKTDPLCLQCEKSIAEVRFDYFLLDNPDFVSRYFLAKEFDYWDLEELGIQKEAD